MPLGWPAEPDDLFVDDAGEPVRIDKAFSWEYPLSVHGLMHNAITNAWRGDPYRIDTLLIFMANMAWNSSMNTSEVRKMLNDRDEDGEYRIPFLIVADAFQSETVAFADLVLPDTSYLERHDCMSMLDRPISEFDGPCDSVRVPVVPAWFGMNSTLRAKELFASSYTQCEAVRITERPVAPSVTTVPEQT